jgi:hypothetical protein
MASGRPNAPPTPLAARTARRYYFGVAETEDYLADDDRALLNRCDLHLYKASGPGGQHRNKVSSAVRLRHRPTGITAHADDSRSQHENKRLAMRRLRMKIACQLRRPLDPVDPVVPPVVSQCLFTPRREGGHRQRRLEIGRRDSRFWPVAAFLLDLLNACEGRLADAAERLEITTGNLAAIFKSESHLLNAAQEIRRRFGQRPIG